MNSVRKLRSCGFWLAPTLGLLLQALPALSEPLSVTLTHTEVAYQINYSEITSGEQSQPFTNEPALDGAKVARGILYFAGEPNHLPFVWDQGGGKLYLDLNRNRDLSDDPEGRFTSNNRGSFQSFSDVRVPFETEHGPHQLLLNLNFYRFRSETHITAGARSFWSGQLSMQERQWQVGLIESPNEPGKPAGASLLLRPWADREQTFAVYDNGASTFRLPELLFLDGQSYAVKCAYSRTGSSPQLRMELNPQTNTLGELQIAGENISRLLLTGKNGGDVIAALIHHPRARIQVPIAEYTDSRVVLRAGDIQACSMSRFSRDPLFTINPDQPSRFVAGGPLTNTVHIEPRGSTLLLSYTLIGADGKQYELTGPRSNPRFTVYRDGKEIATGKFEFG